MGVCVCVCVCVTVLTTQSLRVPGWRLGSVSASMHLQLSQNRVGSRLGLGTCRVTIRCRGRFR